MKKQLDSTQLLEEMGVPEDHKCPYCDSIDIVKTGHKYRKRTAKQVYKCNDCKRKFVFKPSSRGSPKKIKTEEQEDFVMEKHKEGFSLREIQKGFSKKFRKKINRTNVMDFLTRKKKYSPNRITARCVAGIYKDKDMEIEIGNTIEDTKVKVNGKPIQAQNIWIKIRSGHRTTVTIDKFKGENGKRKN